MRTLSLLLLSATLAFPNLSSAQERDESEIVMIGTTEPEMVDAIRTARAGLDDFLALANSPSTGTEQFKLKVMIRDGDATEHFWVVPFRPTGTGFEGVLANDPKVVHNVKAGQQIQFTRNQISDWGYSRNGRQVGSYTVCVLFKKMPPEQADYYRKNHGFDC